uniref:anti-sigma factor family protein n=1 Tax=Paractinoplanes polyasparticus TaxID=2856853 RepID=UPI0021024675|nr:zf-HC2 domain-containing protein [Actinoplanes polyasparticus]
MNTVRCDDFVEWVTDFLEGELPRETERQFVNHLAECDGCDRYLEQMRFTLQQLRTLPDVPLRHAVREQVLYAFRTRPRS